MKRRTKKLIAGIISFMLCLTLNVNPMVVICSAIVESGAIDRLNNLKNNLVYYISTNSNIVKAEEESESETEAETQPPSTTIVNNYTYSCNADAAINKLMGGDTYTIKELNDKIELIKGAVGGIGEIMNDVYVYTDSNGQEQTLNLSEILDAITTMNTALGAGLQHISLGIEGLGSLSDSVEGLYTREENGQTYKITLFDIKEIMNANFKDLNTGLDSNFEDLNTGLDGNFEDLTNDINKNFEELTTYTTKDGKVVHVVLGDILEAINENTGVLKDIQADLQEEFTVINGKMDDVITELGDVNKKLLHISEQLDDINDNIDSMQHNYRVAHLYSLNNRYSNCLWRPVSSDIPYVKDFATVTGKFANVYTGYWDTGVSTLNNPGNSVTKRAQEILGYDIIVRSEGMVLQKDVKKVQSQTAASGLSGNNQSYVSTDNNTDATNSILTYYQEIMPENNITWIDAVTVLYRALGQEQISYQSFMSHDKSITPETSPVYQGLSNPVPDKDNNYAGYDFYMFLTRSNIISNALATSGKSDDEISETLGSALDKDTAAINYLYWKKALNGGFIPSTYVDSAREPITFSEFFKLASRMMMAYGEPVLNDSELKALLQVYGTHYPIQLGTDIADAWAYLAARGILDFSEFTEGQESLLYDITYTGYITRDQLLTMCMRIADEDSRTDYKKINIVLNLSEVMQEDYYYPVYDMKISNGQFAVSTSYDHTASPYYDYLFRKSNEVTFGDIGTVVVLSEKTTDMNKRIEGAYADTTPVILSDGSQWYHVAVPKEYTDNFYIAMHVEGDAKLQNNTVSYIEVTGDCLGGGYYSKYIVDGDVASVSIDNGSYLLFDKKIEYATRNYTDYSRAKEEKPKSTSVSSNATVLEWLSAKVEQYTEPMTVYAKATIKNDYIPYNDMVVQYYNNNQSKSNVDIENANGLEETKLGAGINAIDLGLNKVSYSLDEPLFEFSSSNNISGACYFRYGNTEDKILLNRLSTLDEFDYYSYSHKYKTIKNEMENYLNGEKLGIGTYWSSLRNDPSKQYPIKTNESVSFEYSKPKDAILTQFIFGLCAEKYTVDYEITREYIMEGTREQDPKCTWNRNAYRTWDNSDDNIGTEYKKFLNEWLGILYNEEQDELITRLYNDGLIGVTQTGMSKYNVRGKEASILSLSEALGMTENKAASSNGQTIAGSSIETSVATSTIMDRNQQILISWKDMCDSGYIVNTGTNEQPKMQSNGAYYFMTKEGQVIVNDTQKTIQIGNTLYDLYSGESSPNLVYIDTEQSNTMYFDYRCVMGIVSSQFTISDGKTETLQNHLGVGNCVVYDLQSNGVTSDWFNTVSIRCYNYPETGVGENGNSFVTSNQGYSVNIIKSTLYDGMDIDDDVYWADSNNMSRLRMSTFVPTANYLCFIKDNDVGPEAELYVYYLRTAFEDGFVDKWSDHLKFVPQPEDADVRWAGLADKVSEASRMYSTGGSSLKELLEGTYGYKTDDENMPWYLKMTYDAIAHLYSLTGKYYFSEDYVIRRFDLTNQTISHCVKWDMVDKEGTENKSTTSNDAGAIYWVDSIGYIYNMPTTDEFSLEKYLSGEYLLPLAIDESDKSNPKIINYNLNFYGTSVGYSDNQAIQGEILPYGVTLSPNENSPYVRIDGAAYKSISGDDVAKNGNMIITEESSEAVLPFLQSYSPGADKHYNEDGFANYFIPAPVGIYNKFGGNQLETWPISKMTAYITDSSKVYYGSTQIKLDVSDSQSSAKVFKFMSPAYNSIAIDGSTETYRVYRSAYSGDVLIVDPNNVLVNYGSGVGKVEIDDYYTNPLDDWLEDLGASSLLTKIDEGASFIIVFTFRVMPIIGVIIMTGLMALSMTSDNKQIQTLCDKYFDPIRFLTIGHRNIHNWHWRTVLIPCTLLYISFALFLNGNVIKIIMWGAEWFGTIIMWFKRL